MSNATEPPKANGLVSLLTTLASGDNGVKALMILGLLANTWLTKNNGTGIKENNRELDLMRKQVAAQVAAIYNNQKVYVDLWDEERADHIRIFEKLGIPYQPRQPIKRQYLPEVTDPLNYTP